MIADQVTKYVKREKMVTNSEYVSTGSDLLDLVTGGGYKFGAITNIVGDSSSGKSFLSCEAVFQAKKKFGDKVKVRYNDSESGFTFDTKSMYGFDIREDMVATPTIQGLMADIGIFAKNLKKDEYGFYIVDSFDGLASEDDIAEYEERVKLAEKDKEYNKGSFKMAKQKFAVQLFRTIATVIDKKKIAVIIISQIRDNVGGSMYEKKWRISGGSGLKFFSDIRLFVKSVEKFEVEGRAIGYTANVEALKSRSKWPNRNCNVSFLFEFGMDRTGSNIDYLFDLRDDYGKLKPASVTDNVPWKNSEKEVDSKSVKEWLKEQDQLDKATEEIKSDERFKRMDLKSMMTWIKENPDLHKIFVDEFGVMSRDDIIEYVESFDMEDEIGERAAKKWIEIEERIKPKRKRKSL